MKYLISAYTDYSNLQLNNGIVISNNVFSNPGMKLKVLYVQVNNYEIVIKFFQNQP